MAPLPPLTGSAAQHGSNPREERDDQKAPKVNALPLVLSSTSRAGTPTQGSAPGRGPAGASRPGTSNGPGSPGAGYGPAADRPGSPSAAQAAGYRNKFTRLRGFSGGQGPGPGPGLPQSSMPLVLEGGVLGVRPSTSYLSQSMGSGLSGFHSGDEAGSRLAPEAPGPQHAWGPQSNGPGAGWQGAGAGPGPGLGPGAARGSGTVPGGSASSGGGAQGVPVAHVNLTLPLEPPGPVYAPIPQVAQAAHLAASGGSTSPGGPGAGVGGGGGGGAGSWASRRNGSSMARHGSHGSRSDGPALEGTGLGVHGGRASSGGPVRPSAAIPHPAQQAQHPQHQHQQQQHPQPYLNAMVPDPTVAAARASQHDPPAPSHLHPHSYTTQPVVRMPTTAVVPPTPITAISVEALAAHTQDATPAQLLARFHRTNLTPQPPDPTSTEPTATTATTATATPSLPGSGSSYGQQTPDPLQSQGFTSSTPPRPGTTTSSYSDVPGGPGFAPSPSPSPSRSSAGPQQPVFVPSRARSQQSRGAYLADLSAAVQKSISAGMGEWDLQPVGAWWTSPDVQERLLRGPLAPEVLKHSFHMQERDIISLYRLLYSYSVGFFTDVQGLLDRTLGAAVGGGGAGGPELRQDLLEAVFRAYAQLWDEALMIVFDSEMASVMADKRAALEALDAGVVELEALKRENEQLQARLADFVKQNIDNMLATRHMKQATTQLEGEVLSLNSANEQLVSHMAGHAVSVATLERQLAAARGAAAAAEGRAAAAEAHLADIKATLSEQNATLGAQYFQIQELQGLVGELQEALRTAGRRRAHAVGSMSFSMAASAPLGGPGRPGLASTAAAGAEGDDLASPSASPSPGLIASREGTGSGYVPPGAAAGAVAGVLGAGGSDGDEFEELERALADRTRAYNLLHADFVVKMHELDEARSREEQLRSDIRSLQAELRAEGQRAAVAGKTADRYRSRWESGRMHTEDLEATNKRLNTKNADLVRSYWPLMTRLREAEAEAAAAAQRAQEAADAAEADRAAREGMEAEVAAARDSAARLRELQEEAESHELEVPADLVSLMSEGQAASLRRFARCAHRRVAHLNTTVVQLLDQVQALQAAGGGNGGGNGGAGPGVGQGLASPGSVAGLGPQASHGSVSVTAVASLAAGVGSAGGGGDDAEADVAALRAAVRQRDVWLTSLGRAMGTLVGKLENLMLRDWETCSALRLEQQNRKRREKRKAQRAVVGPGENKVEGIGQGMGGGGEQDTGKGEEACGEQQGQGQAQKEGQGTERQGGGEGEGQGGAKEDGEHQQQQQEEDKAEEEEHVEDAAFPVASGPLAQLVGGLPETSSVLVAVDRGWERLADSAERLAEWADGLLRRKEQTANHTQLKARLDAALRSLDSANGELLALRPSLEAVRFTARSLEAKYKEAAAGMAAALQRASAAESRLASTQSALEAASEQLQEARGAHKRMEEEYWKAKSVALEAELATGELKAGRQRAQEVAAAAAESVSGLQREARENREMREALQADLVGYKAWVRHMEGVERRYRELLQELAAAQAAREEADREANRATDRAASLEQQLRLKAIEAGALEARVRVLGRDLAEERRGAAEAAEAARRSAAVQLEAAARRADTAEASVAAQSDRLLELEARVSESSRGLAEARARADAAAGQLAALAAERDRLAAHVAASRPLLAAMDAAADRMAARLSLLEDTADARAAAGGAAGLGSLDAALEGLLGWADSALAAFEGVARGAAGDGTAAVLGALEGLVGQLLHTLSKGGKEPLQSITVLKTQLARDDKELASLRHTVAALQAAADEAAQRAERHKADAAAASTQAAASTCRAVDAARRAAAAEAVARQARAEAAEAGTQLAAARRAADDAKAQVARLQRRVTDLESDLAAARTSARNLEAQLTAASVQRSELGRRAEELEAAAGRDREAAREARSKAEVAEAALAAAEARAGQAEAAAEAERREVARFKGEAEAALAAAEEARGKAVRVEQQMLEMQSRHADMLRHDEGLEEQLRAARFEAERLRARMGEVAREAADTEARSQALQQHAWQLQVALTQRQREKEEALMGLVDATVARGVGDAAGQQRVADGGQGQVQAEQVRGAAGQGAGALVQVGAGS